MKRHVYRSYASCSEVYDFENGSMNYHKLPGYKGGGSTEETRMQQCWCIMQKSWDEAGCESRNVVINERHRQCSKFSWFKAGMGNHGARGYGAANWRLAEENAARSEAQSLLFCANPQKLLTCNNLRVEMRCPCPPSSFTACFDFMAK